MNANQYFHARLKYAQQPSTQDDMAVNLSKQELLHYVAFPFIAGQVVQVPSHTLEELEANGKTKTELTDRVLFTNMKAVRAMTFYSSTKPLLEQVFFYSHQELKTEYQDCTSQILSEVNSRGSIEDLRPYIEHVHAPQKQQAFIIMRMDEKNPLSVLNSAYEGVIKPVFLKYGLTTLRIDERLDSGTITDQILAEIASSAVVFADLTDSRPNCYFETGYAIALGKKLILSVKENETLHFDLRNNRFIKWSSELDLRLRLMAVLDGARAGVKLVRFGRDKSGAQEKGKKRGECGYLGFAQR